MFKDAIPGVPRPLRVTRPMDFILWFLVLLFVFVAAGRANAACLSADSAIAQAEARGWRFEPLGKDDASRAIALYEAIPPAGPSAASEAALIHRPEGGGFVLVGQGGAYCASALIHPPNWPGVLDYVLGARS